jgi:hypothetical protein
MAINSLQEFIQRAKAGQANPASSFDFDDIKDTLSNIGNTALESSENLPSKLWGIAKQAPSTAENIVTHPINSLRDFAGGFARQEQNLGAAGLEAGEYLTRKGAEGIGQLMGNPVNIPKWNAREAAGLEGDNQVDLGRMIETKNPDPLLSAIGQYGVGAGALGKGIGSVIAANSLNSAIQAQPGDRLRAGVEGAVNVGLPAGLIKGSTAGYNLAKPSNLLRGTLSPEELQSNLEAAKGTPTSLGDVIDSPTLKRIYENALPHIPLSGAYTKMQETANKFTEKGENLLDKIGANLPSGDKTQLLQDALKKASQQALTDKQADYAKVNKIADDIGLVVGREKFQSKAKSLLDNLEKSPELKRKFPTGLLSDLEEYANNSKGNTLELSNIFRGKLGSEANTLYTQGATHEYGVVKSLKDALDSDIKGAIKDSNNANLKTEYEKAQANYGSKYAPFENPDITKFTKQGGDPDLMLSHFIRTGANDRGELIGRLTTKLPKNLQNLPLHMYLSKAIEDGKLNPVKLNTLYNKLGKKQVEALVPDKSIRKELENYTKGIGMNKEAFNTMFNPKTGQRNSDSLIGALEAMAGYGVGGLKGMALAVPAAGAAARIGTHLLTNESIRNALVKKMIKQSKK